MEQYGFYSVQLYEKLSAELRSYNDISHEERTIMRDLSEYDFFGEIERGSIEPTSGVLRGTATTQLIELQYAVLMSMPDALKTIYDSYTDDRTRDYDGAFMTAADNAFSLLKENKLQSDSDILITSDLIETCKAHDIPVDFRENSSTVGTISSRDYFLSTIPEYTEKHDAIVDLRDKWRIRINLNNHEKANVIIVESDTDTSIRTYELQTDKFGYIKKKEYADNGTSTESIISLDAATSLIDQSLSNNERITAISDRGERRIIEAKNGRAVVSSDKDKTIKGTIQTGKNKKSFSAEEKKEYWERKENEKKEAYEKLLSKVDDVFSSDEFMNYLNFSAQLHKYSTKNKLLIYMQYPEATYVGSKTAWNKLGGHITAGEKCKIWVFAPVTKKIEDEDKDDDEKSKDQNEDSKTKSERVIAGYKLMPVYDISQITGVQPPELVKPLQGEIDEETFNAIFTGIEKVCGIKPTFKPLKDGLDGYFSLEHNTITLNSNMSDLQKVLAYVHESAHSVFHRKGGPFENESKENQEIQAESSAYLVCKQLGYETDINSIPYIATYKKSKSKEELLKTLEVTEHFVEAMVKSISQQIDELEKRRQSAKQTITYSLAPDGDGFVISTNADDRQLTETWGDADYIKDAWFETVEDALEFAKKDNIVFDNSDDELREWSDIDILLDKQKLERFDKFYSMPPERVMWNYYNPDANSGEGELVEAIIYERDMRGAYDEYMNSLAYDPQNAEKHFMDSLYTSCRQTAYADNADNSGYFETYKNESADLMIEGKLINKRESAERLIEFFKENCRSFALYVSYRENEGVQKTDTDMAVKMWENGFEIKTNDGMSLPAYASVGDIGYSAFDNDGQLFICSKVDYKMQKLIDRISTSAEELNRYGYNLGIVGQKLRNYSPMRTVEQNMQEALSGKEYSVIEEYFRTAHSQEFGNGEIAVTAKNAAKALEELINLDSSKAAYQNNTRK
ncbi:protein of unknown function [Ruminococcus sp. YE71]|uniref:ArdC-like ssDNA-binding domain-containing protein n=1 Tax=unclassified Ruminococcus TaxID=2608920 RepID=UPI00088C3A25|nr:MULTISPECIES: ArdC-like ssDNA-binding domain-containing protein [unclassified Ruminococcus]SDA31047.1 protein of unknown function [Ruminococcus sp. YE78]SFW50936.1 protein of unknown function [Ruminococcus sp. YE71]